MSNMRRRLTGEAPAGPSLTRRAGGRTTRTDGRATRTITVAAIAGALVALPLALTACAPSVQGVCVDYMYWDAPADAAEHADVVILGTVTDLSGRGMAWDVIPTRVVTLNVDEVLSGELADATVDVVALPPSCAESNRDVAAGDDAFRGAEIDTQLVVMLNDVDGEWETATPDQAVLTPGPGGTVPTAYPTPLH